MPPEGRAPPGLQWSWDTTQGSRPTDLPRQHESTQADVYPDVVGAPFIRKEASPGPEEDDQGAQQCRTEHAEPSREERSHGTQPTPASHHAREVTPQGGATHH